MSNTTPRDDIAGLSERLQRQASDYPGVGLFTEAATQLDALSAGVKELERTAADALARMMDAQMKIGAYQGYATGAEARAKDMKSRAIRAEQERDEAYERAAQQAEQFAPPHSMDLGKGHVGWRIAEAIRRLAPGPEKEDSPPAGTEG